MIMIKITQMKMALILFILSTMTGQESPTGTTHLLMQIMAIHSLIQFRGKH